MAPALTPWEAMRMAIFIGGRSSSVSIMMRTASTVRALLRLPTLTLKQTDSLNVAFKQFERAAARSKDGLTLARALGDDVEWMLREIAAGTQYDVLRALRDVQAYRREGKWQQ